MTLSVKWVAIIAFLLGVLAGVVALIAISVVVVGTQRQRQPVANVRVLTSIPQPTSSPVVAFASGGFFSRYTRSSPS